MTTTTDNNESTKKKKLFYTTSDMMKTINKSIAGLDSPGDAISPRVELQRRMPDGSTRRASNQDLQAADMDSKLKQAAEQVSDLSPKQKIEWAQRLRQEGNLLYKDGEYREALDVYLTCLVAKSDDEKFLELVFLPVMNNLAQCCLQLGMYQKAIQFCTVALEEINEGDENDQAQELVAKLYFRRGRARRLSGDYAIATSDLKHALTLLQEESTEFRSVQREIQLVQRAKSEERENEKRQEASMKRLLGGKASATTGNGSGNNVDPMEQHQQPSSLYQRDDTTRAYSTLTAKQQEVDEEDPASQNCWKWYLSVVGRVAGKLLVLLGDEEYSGRRAEEDVATNKDRKLD